MCAQHANGVSIIVAEGDPSATNPHGGTVLVAIAQDLVVGLVGIGSMLRKVLERGLQVMRVDEIRPC